MLCLCDGLAGCSQVRRHGALALPQADPAAEAAERREPAEHVGTEQGHQHSPARSRLALTSLLWASRARVCRLTVLYPSVHPARTLHEASLHESIRYAPRDPVEKWLNELLCLDCLNIPRLVSGCPLPQTCDLYPSVAQWGQHRLSSLTSVASQIVSGSNLLLYISSSPDFKCYLSIPVWVILNINIK